MTIKIYIYNYASYSYSKSTYPERKLPVEGDEIQIVDTRPAFNRNYS